MNRFDTDRRHAPVALTLVIAAAMLVAACETSGPTSLPTGALAAPTAAPTAAVVTPAASTPAATNPAPTPATRATISQAPPPNGLSVAPESARVDIAMPVFSHPTQVTNPLFPISAQYSVLMLGHVDGRPFRTEVTLLHYTRVIDWAGMRVETLVSQYNAFLDGRIQEVAFDYYAQADDGSVWYFGEDVFDFADGVIISTDGTWLAGRDAPAAMIMPGQPKVGDVYRPENAPGFVFEEVTVEEVGVTLEGPLGPIEGGLRIKELHADGAFEEKLFAPGYGEFLTGGGGDLEALALGVPTDAVEEPVPAELARLTDGTLRLFDAAGRGHWKTAASTVADMNAAWAAMAAGIVPRLIVPLITAELKTLTGARGGAEARSSAGRGNRACSTGV